MKNSVFSKRWAIYWFVLLVVIFLQIILAWTVVINNQKTYRSEIENNAARNIQFLHTLIQERLQNKEYDSVDYFLQQWGKSYRQHVAEISLTTANGFVLSHYQTDSKPAHIFSLTNTIPYSYLRSATLSLVIDTDSIFRHSSRLALTFGGLIFLSSLFLVTLTWLYIRQNELSINLKNSEEKYRSLIENTPDIRYKTDAKGKIVYISPSVHTLSGYTVEESIGKHMTGGIVDPQERDLLLTSLRKDGYVHDFTAHLKRKDGSTWWASANIESRKNHNGNIIGMEGVVRDVTERVKAKILLRKRELKLESILQSAPTGIGMVVDRIFQEVNQQFCKITGYSEEELLGQNERMVYPSDEEYQKVGREQMKLIHKFGIGTIETYLRHKNGQTINILVSWKPLNEDDVSAGIIFNALDITETKKLEAQPLQSQKMESIGTLAGGIAHDFNNILTAIKGYVQMVLMNLEANSEQWHNVEQIQQASDRAATLTRQLLGFSRKQMIMPRPVDINQLITDMGKMLGRLIDENIRLEISFDGQIGKIYADPGQMEQILMNLVVNAQDAIREQPERAEKIIKISSTRIFLDQDYVAVHQGSSPGWHLRLQVEDSGCGMSAEIKKHIFEPFFTTKGVGKGTGMGLAMVYGIVKQNEGSIYVYSEPDQGTTFKIYWPIMAEKGLEEVATNPQPAIGGGETILLAEDDEQIRKISSLQLRQAGYTILEAENGLDALEQARNHQGKIDLLFTDVVMPIMGGNELHKKIKDIYPDIPVIFSSGYTDDNLPKEMLKLSKEQFINKPYSLQDIMAKIRRLLDR